MTKKYYQVFYLNIHHPKTSVYTLFIGAKDKVDLIDHIEDILEEWNERDRIVDFSDYLIPIDKTVDDLYDRFIIPITMDDTYTDRPYRVLFGLIREKKK